MPFTPYAAAIQKIIVSADPFRKRYFAARSTNR
jgi:hypothetical protein